MYKSIPEHPAFTRGGSKAMMLKFWVGNRTDAEPNATPVIEGVLKDCGIVVAVNIPSIALESCPALAGTAIPTDTTSAAHSANIRFTFPVLSILRL
jgi:hypothetical protein